MAALVAAPPSIASHFDQHGTLLQEKWFVAAAGASSAAVERALSNSIRAGADHHIVAAYKAYKDYKDDSDVAAKPLSLQTYVALLTRIAATDVYVGGASFGGIRGSALAQYAASIYADAAAAGHKSEQLDLLLLRAARFVAVDDAHITVRIFRAIAANKSASALASATASPESATSTSTPKQSSISIAVCNELIAALSMHGNVAACKALISRMLDVGIQAEVPTFCHLLEAYCRAGDLASAEGLYGQIAKHGTADQIHFANERLLRYYSATGNITKSHKYFDLITRSARSSSAQHSKSHHSTSTYNSMIRAFTERGLPGDAISTYKKMRRDGIEADTDTYALLIRVFGRSKNLTAASRVFYKKENVPGFQPSSDMYAALIEAYVLSGSPLLAWRTLRDSLVPWKQKKSSLDEMRLPRDRTKTVPASDEGVPTIPRHFPVSLVTPLAKDLAGKHMDYLADHFRLANLPTATRGMIIARLMQAALVDDVFGAKDAALASALYAELTSPTGCARSTDVPPLANACAIEALGEQNASIDTIVALFERTLEDAVMTGQASEAFQSVFTALSKLSDKQAASQRALALASQMQTDGVQLTAPVLSSLVSCFASVDEAKTQLSSILKAAVDAGVFPSTKQHNNLFEIIGEDAIKDLCGRIG
eukprot:jgi/Hompol1/7057/HPOL_005170-RA